jgi:hypothetical protein
MLLSLSLPKIPLGMNLKQKVCLIAQVALIPELTTELWLKPPLTMDWILQLGMMRPK